MRNQIIQWEMDWIYRNQYRRAERRGILAGQLRQLRAYGGNALARLFIRNMLWVGVYPVRSRR